MRVLSSIFTVVLAMAARGTMIGPPHQQQFNLFVNPISQISQPIRISFDDPPVDQCWPPIGCQCTGTHCRPSPSGIRHFTEEANLIADGNCFPGDDGCVCIPPHCKPGVVHRSSISFQEEKMIIGDGLRLRLAGGIVFYPLIASGE